MNSCGLKFAKGCPGYGPNFSKDEKCQKILVTACAPVTAFTFVVRNFSNKVKTTWLVPLKDITKELKHGEFL